MNESDMYFYAESKIKGDIKQGLHRIGVYYFIIITTN